MRVAFIMPTHFDTNSVIAGGERYAYELSKGMAKKVSTTLFTFSPHQKVVREGELTIRYCPSWYGAGGVVNPISFSHLQPLCSFDVIHCLQLKTIATETAILLGALRKKKVFVTDLAGGTIYSMSRLFPIHRLVKKFLLISEFNRVLNQKIAASSEIIYGGVDAEQFRPGAPRTVTKKLLYVGRIFPLKGLHILLEALPSDCQLEIVGQCHDAAYLNDLKAKSAGKNVVFYDSLSDGEVINKYQSAMATVLPSLVDGGFTSAMESMACGTPVIGTRVGSLPEVVKDGISGFLVPPNDAVSLRKKIEDLLQDPNLILSIRIKSRQEVLNSFTWDKVVERCLKAYNE